MSSPPAHPADLPSSRHRLREALWLGVAVVVAGLLALVLYLQTPILWFVSVLPSRVPHFEDTGAPRILVVAPHPDDDILGVGGTLADQAAAGARIVVVYLTSGDANKASGRLITLNPFHWASVYRALGHRRQKEAVLSLQRLGISPRSAVFLNYPDRGLTALLENYWLPEQPYKSRFTRQTSVYSDVALRPDAQYCGLGLVEDLMDVLHAFRPTVVYLPHPQDAHPDHVSSYRLTMLALEKEAIASPEFEAPELRCYLVHLFEGRWPVPSGINLSLPLGVLPPSVADDAWMSVPLSDEAVQAKLAAIRAHFSQWMISSRFLAGFVRTNEVYLPVVMIPTLTTE